MRVGDLVMLKPYYSQYGSFREEYFKHPLLMLQEDSFSGNMFLNCFGRVVELDTYLLQVVT